MIFEGIKQPYEQEHTVNLKSLNIRCSDEVAEKMHAHYEKTCVQLRDYWDEMCDLHMWNIDDWMNTKLQFNPKKVKGQRMLASSRFKRMDRERIAKYGKYYTHEQMLNMIEVKVNTTRDKGKLADFTESMRMRFNAYLNWVIQFDEKYNQGKYVAAIEKIKVDIRKPKGVLAEAI